MKAEQAKKELKKYSNKEKAKQNSSFFKTGKGEYGEGDMFIGVYVPDTRKVAKEFKEMSLMEVKRLLLDKIHEVRLLGLLILVEKYKGKLNTTQRAEDKNNKKQIYDFYLKNTKYVNNWDLVDQSAYQIVGDFLLNNKDRKILYKLSKSKNIWEQRISIVSTYRFIQNKELDDTFKISEILLDHDHDLMHKAVGWMLREAGKKDLKKLKTFLKKNYKKIPRTMLRYSIEKFPKGERDKYLKGEI